MAAKKIIVSILAIIMIASTGFCFELSDGVNLSGSMRWRGELDDKDFNFSTGINELQYLRTRLALDINTIENTQVFIQIQDSRNLGTNSAGLSNDTNLGLHQGYIKVNKLFSDALSLQLGRFEAVYGRQRLIGSVGWHNVGRSFDGIRASYVVKDNKYDFFVLKLVDRSFNTPPNHRDSNLLGFYGTVLDKHLDLFLLHERDITKVGDDLMLERFTTGIYYQREINDNIKTEWDFAYQFGKQAGLDISAFMIAGEFKYKLSDSNTKIGAGFDVTSGDDDLSDSDIKFFNNLYYTGHKFRGYMDYFIAPVSAGLMDIFLKGSFKPADYFTINADFHHFMTMEDYSTGSGTSKQVGQELDLTGKYPVNKQLKFVCGASLFIASDDYMPDADLATWFYTMLVASFK